MAAIAKDSRLSIFLAVRTLVTFNTTMWATYAMIYLTDSQGVGLPKPSIAYLPFVTAITTMGLIFLINRRNRPDAVLNNLIAGQALWLASALFFVTSPAADHLVCDYSTFLGAMSLVLFQPANQTYWANIVEDQRRAQVFSAGTALSTLFQPGSRPSGRRSVHHISQAAFHIGHLSTVGRPGHDFLFESPSGSFSSGKPGWE